MTKISSKYAYPKKTPIVDDYFVGTDSEDFGKTVNFGFEAVAGLVNKLNGTPIINYIFSTSPYLSTEVLLEGRFLSDENVLNTSSLTKLHINRFNNSGEDLRELFLFLKDNATDFYLKLRNSNNQNNTVYFDITSIQYFTDYFVFNIVVFKENEFLPLLENQSVYFFDFDLKASFTGEIVNIDNRLSVLESAALPDAVLEHGEVVIVGNAITVAANDFQWRLEQENFFITSAFSGTIISATEGFYRSNILVGNNAGVISLIEGVEDAEVAIEPPVPSGYIKLSSILVFGSEITTPPILPNYSDQFLKRYKFTYKTSQVSFDINPGEDDYNIIYNNTATSYIGIHPNGHNGKYIKNGAIYPFKSMGTGDVIILNDVGVTLNSPNGNVLNKNQQCYLIKDDYNEWTLVNPVNLDDVDDRLLALESFTPAPVTGVAGKAYAIWTGVGYVYDVVYDNYYIDGVLYPAGTNRITLDTSDVTNPRIDVFALDATGGVKITGTPDVNPVAETVDTASQIYVTFVSVASGTTEPVGVSNEDIYKENVEWTNTTNGTVNFNYATNPFEGTKCISMPTFGNGNYIEFTSPTSLNISDYKELGQRIRLNTAWSNSANFEFRFYNGATLISSVVAMKKGDYGFLNTIINTYQYVIIPLTEFTFSQSTFTKLRITRGTGGSGNIQLDNVILTNSGDGISSKQNAITSIITDSGIANATTEDDVFQMKGFGGIVVSAIGKIISFTASLTKSNVGLGNVDNTSDANKPVSTAQQAALDLKLDASAYNQHFLGVYVTLAALNAAHPTASVGDYAQVNEVGATDVVNYNWDAEDSVWVAGGGTGGAANTDALPEGSANLYFTTARVVATLLTGLSVVTGGDVVSTDSVLVAFGKIQKQINDILTALGLKAPLESPALTGTPTAPTATAGTNTTQLATTAFVLANAAVGGGDMVLADDQTVSGIKTFLNGKLGLRNVANTFTSFFTNSNTAARTYTFQNRNGTIADTADVNAKMNNPTSGIANYIPKFLTATTMGLSRLWDAGTYLGIGVTNPPSKDITLGNNSDKEIGVEQSNSTSSGRNLEIKSGRSVNFQISSEFVKMNSNIAGVMAGTAVSSANGNIYVAQYNVAITWIQYGGVGDFVSVAGINPTNINAMFSDPTNGDVFIFQRSTTTLFKQTAGVGSFVSTGFSPGSLFPCGCVAPNGDVYVTGSGLDVYMQTGGAGAFNALGQTIRTWNTMTATPNGDIHCDDGTNVYTRVAGTGNFVLNANSGGYSIWSDGEGYLYSRAYLGVVKKQTSFGGSFVSTGLLVPNGNVYGVALDVVGNIYMTFGGDLYVQNNDILGTANLNGGTLRLKSGTGKGTGISRYEVWTGQKLASGTDMQTETLREYIDENGYHIYTSIPVYADDVAADADAELPSGGTYKLTGSRIIYHKP